MRTVCFVVAVSVLVADAAAQVGSRMWRPDERIVFADFSAIDAVAVSTDRVYGATQGGLIEYDRVMRRWRPPLTVLDGWPRERVLSAAVDPWDESVWFGTATGVVHYRPRLRDIESMFVPGPVTRIVFDRRDAFAGAFLETAGGRWSLYRRDGGVTPVATPPPVPMWVGGETASDVLTRLPAAEGAGAFVLRDARGGRYRYTAASRDQVRGTAYFGTDGMGLVAFDPATTDLEPMPFGLRGSFVAAVHASDGRVWVATLGGAGPVVTVLDADGQVIEHFEGPRIGGFRFREVRALERWRGRVMVISEAGLVPLVGDPAPWLRDVPVHLRAMDSDDGVTWLGSRQGVTRVEEGRLAESALVGPVTALTHSGPTLWVGTGNRVLPLHSADLSLALDVRGHDLGATVVGVASSPEGVVAISEEDVVWQTGGVWRAIRAPLHIVPLSTVRIAEGLYWLGGRDGVGTLDPATGEVRTVLRRADLPGAVRDLALADGYLWVATEGGLVRFQQRALTR